MTELQLKVPIWTITWSKSMLLGLEKFETVSSVNQLRKSMNWNFIFLKEEAQKQFSLYGRSWNQKST